MRGPPAYRPIAEYARPPSCSYLRGTFKVIAVISSRPTAFCTSLGHVILRGNPRLGILEGTRWMLGYNGPLGLAAALPCMDGERGGVRIRMHAHVSDAASGRPTAEHEPQSQERLARSVWQDEVRGGSFPTFPSRRPQIPNTVEGMKSHPPSPVGAGCPPTALIVGGGLVVFYFLLPLLDFLST